MGSSNDCKGGPKSLRQKAQGVKNGSAPSFEVMPVAELCRQVFILACRGNAEAAAALARSIPLDFPWAWCREDEFSEEKTGSCLALLKLALRSGEAPLRGDPYFHALAQHLSKSLSPPRDFKPVLDWSLIETASLKCCFTFWGSSTSLASLISDGAEIRAVGPQTYPLSAPKGFGIRPVREHGNRWASPVAAPAVWFEMRANCKGKQIYRAQEGFVNFGSASHSEGRFCKGAASQNSHNLMERGISLDLTFFGLEPSAALAFSFYVKAECAQIGGEKLKPKTLQRYQGVSKPVRFGSGLTIESKTEGKMELIPLAGGGGYWDCEYLAAFEIHPINAKMSFLIYLQTQS